MRSRSLIARLRSQLPLPPAELRFMGEDDESFITIGDGLVDELAAHAGMTMRSRVLDIGCGYGRLAHALIRRGFRGRYLGFDVLERHIEWCRRHLGRRRIEFRHLDVRNERYNPDGKLVPAEVQLGAGPFDVVVLFSVFTHMWPEDVLAYLRLLPPLLAPSGKVVATFFLLDDEWRALAERGAPEYDLPHERAPHCRYRSADEPLHVVAYERDWVLAEIERHGLRLAAPVSYGTWSGRAGAGPAFQDTVVLAPAAS